MHFLKLSTIFAFAMSTFVTADFDLYRVERTNYRGSKSQAYQIFSPSRTPTCEQVMAQNPYPKSNNVSGSNIGVVCEGSSACGLGDDPSRFSRIEMHFANYPLFHWTFYKDWPVRRNGRTEYAMYGLNGRTYGWCWPQTGHSYDCGGVNTRREGMRKFRCDIDRSAEEIVAGVW